MDCCGSSKPKEKDEDLKDDKTGINKNPVEKEQNPGGGCCGGGGSGMWLHLAIMIIVVVVISYFTRR